MGIAAQPAWNLDYHGIPTTGWRHSKPSEKEELMQSQAATKSLTGELAVALFTETRSVRDAVVDLRQAGFGPNQIFVAFSAEHDQFDPQHAELWQTSRHGLFGGEHSMIWRMRHSFERDLHQRTGEVQEQEPEANPHACTEVNLHDALKAIGVAEDRIWLVNQQVGAHGALIIVNAGMERIERRKAEAILEKNCGQTRTGTATERPPGSWRSA
jgi:hypothetical protein